MSLSLIRFLLPALLALWAPPAPDLAATAGFRGHYRPGTWVQVSIAITNPGPAFTGNVEAVGEEGTRYAELISIPEGGTARVRLHVPLDWARSSLLVRLRRGDRIVAETQVPLRPLPDGDRLIAVLSGSSGPQTDFPAGRHAEVVEIAPTDLPAQALAWGSLDVLVVRGQAALSVEQLGALRTWLDLGGHLIFAGLIPPDLAALAPAEAGGAARLDPRSALGAFGAGSAPPGPVDVLRLLPGPGSSLVLGQGDTPLAVRSSVGRGSVTVVAFAPRALGDWEGSASLWSHLMSSPSERPPWAAGVSGWLSAYQALRTVPGYSRPPLGLILAFSLAYALLAGPLNFAVLARLRQRRLAWLTVFGLSLLFAGAAWMTARNYDGSRSIVHRLAVVQAPAGATHGRADMLIGVFAPRRGDYALRVESALVRPLPLADSGPPKLLPNLFRSEVFAPPALIHQDYGAGPPADITSSTAQIGLRLDVGQMAAFTMSTVVPTPPLSGEVSLELGDVPRARGWVRNSGHAALEDAVLLAERGFAALGTLSPGERREFSVVLDAEAPSSQMTTSAALLETGLLAWSQGASQRYAHGYVPLVARILGTEDYWTRPEVTRRFLLLAALLTQPGARSTVDRPVGVALMGWQAGAPAEAQVGGASRAIGETLYIWELPARGPLAGVPIAVPAALMTWQVLDSGRVAEPSPYSLYLRNQAVVFRFQPWPAVAPSQVESLTLHLGRGVYSGQPIPLPALALRDWRTGEWDTLSALRWGPNDVAYPAKYVGPSGAIDARVSAGAEPVSLLQIEFSMSGTR